MIIYLFKKGQMVTGYKQKGEGYYPAFNVPLEDLFEEMLYYQKKGYNIKALEKKESSIIID